MFKKGQLVKNGEELFITTSDQFPGGLVCVSRNLNTPVNVGVVVARNLTLIGNNYKPKLTDKK